MGWVVYLGDISHDIETPVSDVKVIAYTTLLRSLVIPWKGLMGRYAERALGRYCEFDDCRPYRALLLFADTATDHAVARPTEFR